MTKKRAKKSAPETTYDLPVRVLESGRLRRLKKSLKRTSSWDLIALRNEAWALADFEGGKLLVAAHKRLWSIRMEMERRDLALGIIE